MPTAHVYMWGTYNQGTNVKQLNFVRTLLLTCVRDVARFYFRCPTPLHIRAVRVLARVFIHVQSEKFKGGGLKHLSPFLATRRLRILIFPTMPHSFATDR